MAAGTMPDSNASAVAAAEAGAAPRPPPSSTAAIMRGMKRRSATIALWPWSVAGFGGDQLPVGIARRHVAGECPHVGDLGHLFRGSIDHGTGAVARDRDQLRDEPHRDLCGLPAQLGMRGF